MAELMPITPSVLKWARQRAGISIDTATNEFKKIASWESGDDAPSYPQLEKLADKFKIPIAVFFFPEPPDLPPIEESFRTLGADQFEQIPSRIRLLLLKARTFQMGLEELNLGRNPAPRLITRDVSFQPHDDVELIAAKLRDYLNVPIELQFSWKDTDGALVNWRRALINVGVYVFKDQFRQDSFSGFCLYDDEFPIIYVNNTTAKSRQIFTIFHELAHLLFHTSGVDTPDDDYINGLPTNERLIEIICNRLAARFLVPEDAFEQAFANSAPTEATATDLARLFCVSREFIFRIFLDRELISKEEYESAALKWTIQKKPSSSGDHYNSKIAYLGTEYITLAFQRYYQNQINAEQLADYLDTKPRNLTRLEEYISRRNP